MQMKLGNIEAAAIRNVETINIDCLTKNKTLYYSKISTQKLV